MDKKHVVILLSILLAFAFITILLIYWRYSDTKEALSVNERKLYDSKERIAQLEQENSALSERVHEGSKHFEELQRARKRISELENSNESLNKEMVSAKDMVTGIREQLENSELNVSRLREEIEKSESEMERFRNQLSDLRKQNDEATVLIEQLKSEHENVVSELNKGQSEIAELKTQLSDVEAQKQESEAQAEQMKSDFEAAVYELNQEMRERNRRVAELESELKEARSKASVLKDKIKEGEGRIESLEQRISKLLGEKDLLKTQMHQLKSTHASMVSELKNEVKNKEVTIEELEDKLTITFVDRILFEFGKANISPEGREILTRVGKILRNVKDKKIRVVGHTDNVPIMDEYRYKFPSNWELSAARAAAVVRHFQKGIGIDPENLEAVGRSFYEPIANNQTDKGRAQNRRVNIIIAPKID